MRNQAGWPAAWELDTHPLVSSGLGHQSVQATYLGQTLYLWFSVLVTSTGSRRFRNAVKDGFPAGWESSTF